MAYYRELTCDMYELQESRIFASPSCYTVRLLSQEGVGIRTPQLLKCPGNMRLLKSTFELGEKTTSKSPIIFN